MLDTSKLRTGGLVNEQDTCDLCKARRPFGMIGHFTTWESDGHVNYCLDNSDCRDAAQAYRPRTVKGGRRGE